MVISLEQLESMGDSWQSLANVCRVPMLDHDWVVSAARAFCRPEDLRIVTVDRCGELVGAAPLVKDGARGRVALLGAAQLFEPGNWLAADAAAMRQLADAVLQLGEPLVVERIPQQGPLVSALTASAARGLVVRRGNVASHFVDTTGSWDDCSARFSRRWRWNQAQMRERLEREIGPVRLQLEFPTPAETPAALDRFAAIEAAGWKGRLGSALRYRPALQRFFGEYCQRVARRGGLRVAALVADDTTLAMELAVEAHGRLWALKTSYNEAFDRYGPGVQLIHESIRATCESGLATYEFLGSAESWQRRWHPSERQYTVVAVYPHTVLGLTTIGHDALTHLRRWAGR